MQRPRPEVPAGRLTTSQAADLLGVKPATLYAYVSRGLLSSERSAGGRASTFDAAAVEKLAGRIKRDHGGVITGAGGRTFSLRTSITLIDDDRLWFRGVDAIELARTHTFEEVADWLWTGVLHPGVRFAAPDRLRYAARAAVAALPASAGMLDRLRAAAIAAAAADPLRFEFDEYAVIDTARNLIGTLVEALPSPTGAGSDGTLAERLWPRLTGVSPSPDGPAIAALNGALVLLADHDLAVSTLAARVAASSRAHPYAVVSAALGALDGPLHGAASGLAHRMLAEVVERGSAAPVVAAYLRAGSTLPGLGHRLYKSEDPRATALFELLERVPAATDALAAAREICAVASRHANQPANVDLALAVLSVGAGMPADGGETVFAVARTAGWIAHAIEEYDEAPLRLRLTARYAGPRPPQPAP